MKTLITTILIGTSAFIGWKYRANISGLVKTHMPDKLAEHQTLSQLKSQFNKYQSVFKKPHSDLTNRENCLKENLVSQYRQGSNFNLDAVEEVCTKPDSATPQEQE